MFASLKFKSDNKRRSRGATMVEASLAMGIAVIFALFVTDLLRYFYAYITLNYAAQNAADYASKLSVEMRTDQASCNPPFPTPAPNPNPCAQYLDTLDRVADKALENAKRAVALPGESGSAELLNLDHYYEAPQNHTSLPSVSKAVALVRPGEKVRAWIDGKWEVYEHPMRDFSTGWPGVSENWSGVMEETPLMVLMVAKFNPVLPFLGNITMESRQYSYRVTSRFGAKPPKETPKATQSPTPTVSPSATPVPTNTPLPTATPPPTATPVPTATATSAPTPTTAPTSTPTTSGSSGGSGGGCFLAGTLITMADGSKVPIELIRIGDSVMAYDERDKSFKPRTVVQLFEHPNVWGYMLVNGFLKVTYNHSFYTGGKWVQLGKLKVGYELMDSEGKAYSIKSIERVNDTVTTYNLEVDELHNYLAGGILVHNGRKNIY